MTRIDALCRYFNVAVSGPFEHLPVRFYEFVAAYESICYLACTFWYLAKLAWRDIWCSEEEFWNNLLALTGRLVAGCDFRKLKFLKSISSGNWWVGHNCCTAPSASDFASIIYDIIAIGSYICSNALLHLQLARVRQCFTYSKSNKLFPASVGGFRVLGGRDLLAYGVILWGPLGSWVC